MQRGEVVGTLAPHCGGCSAGVPSTTLRTGIGRNGAGKSTLLKILSRITEPASGRAEIHGRVANLLEVGAGSHSDPELILRLGSGPARTSALRQRRDASRGHEAERNRAEVR